MPDTPKTLSLADFTKETKELETKIPNMSEAERKAVADKLLADQKTLSAADQAKLATMISEQANISNGQTEHAHDYSSFLSALRNANASTIVLDNDIDFNNANLKHGLLNLQGGNWERLNNKGIARTVTIQGSKKTDGTITELKFGDRYIAFTDDNQSNGQGWHIKLSDLTLQTETVYGPLYFALVGVTNAGQDTLNIIMVLLRLILNESLILMLLMFNFQVLTSSTQVLKTVVQQFMLIVSKF